MLTALALAAGLVTTLDDAVAQPTRDLAISVVGTGAGTVTSAPGGISCPGDCDETYAIATPVALTFTPASGSSFGGASGHCSSGASLTSVIENLTMSQNRACTVTFTAIQHSLSVSLAGAGSGTISSTPAGISCSAGTCASDFNEGTVVTLTASPAVGSTFTGWSGACSGTGAASVTLNAAASCTATFGIASYTLSVGVTGTGTVTSSPAGISCGAGTCAAAFSHGTSVSLSAAPGAGSTFTGWSGACSGTGAATVTMTAAASCTATFTPSHALSVTVTGGGSGSVASAPAGISCSSGTCSASFAQGTSVTLTATAAAGSTFAGWSGACSGTGAASVTLNAATACTATFTSPNRTLTVSLAGSGSGTVTSAPAGLTCSAGTCSASFTTGTSVTLTATPASGSTFSGWSGACSGSGAATLTLSSNAACTATFAVPTKTLAITISGSGGGAIVSSPAGIACAKDSGVCTASFPVGTSVTLSTAAAPGSSFEAWSGCSTAATSSIAITMSADTACTATFASSGKTLVLTLSGPGRGTVTSTPTGLDCSGGQGTVCSAGFAGGAQVTLTASPAAGSSFAGWSGQCSATGPSTGVVTLNADTSCGAVFELRAITAESGWWWNPDEAGRGYSLEVSTASGETRAFLGAYMYDESGDPVWYVSSMTSADDGRTFTGTLLSFRGGQTLLGRYRAPAGAPVGYGSTDVRVEFTSTREGAIVFPAPDEHRSATRIPIARFAFAAGGLAPAVAGDSFAAPQAGWWWNPDESGRGMFFETQPDGEGGITLFSAIYGYDASGAPSWIIGMATLLQSAGGWVASSMPLHRCANGQMLGARGGKPASCTPMESSATTIQFEAGGSRALVTLPSGTPVPLQRYAF